ncbi:MAG: phosphate uptake regulator PhoU [Nanoarchaeota archaeon]|nr:phosphate uptake regulator PhoU [Nanoarchaeota archaeon]
MEYRKLIKFGNNSFVISLPKNWIIQNRLEKGSLIYLLKTSNQIILSPQKQAGDSEEKSITLDARNEKIETIQRKIISCYINNYKKIMVLYDTNEIAKEIRAMIQNLMALEVIEQTANMIVAMDYLNMHDISIASLIRKNDNIIRSMFKDLLSCLKKNDFDKELSENIIARDLDVNRLTFVIMRAVKNAMTDPHMKKEGTDLEYFNFYELAQYMERMADEIKRIVRLLYQDCPKNLSELYEVAMDVEKIYLNAMKTYYNKDTESAYKVATEKNQVMDKINKYQESHTAANVHEAFGRFKNVLLIIHSAIRLIYQ